MIVEFEWDRAKAKRNLREHGVSFEEAESVIENPASYVEDDIRHSENEERIKVIGPSMKQRLLVVITTDRGEKVRIISARKATTKESRQYVEENEKR
jgi:uncharacterized protein